MMLILVHVVITLHFFLCIVFMYSAERNKKSFYRFAFLMWKYYYGSFPCMIGDSLTLKSSFSFFLSSSHPKNANEELPRRKTHVGLFRRFDSIFVRKVINFISVLKKHILFIENAVLTDC